MRKESRGSRVSDFVYATAMSSCDIHEGHVWILFAILSEQAPGNVDDVVRGEQELLSCWLHFLILHLLTLAACLLASCKSVSVYIV